MRLARRYNVIPVRREVVADMETPVSAFMKTAGRPYSFLLESVEGGANVGRWSFIGGDPYLLFRSKGRKIVLSEKGKKEVSFETARDPLFELEKLLKRFRQAPVEGLPPFSGGAVGYLGYDTVRFIEKVPDSNPDPLGVPDSLFAFTDTLLAFDNLKRNVQVIANAVVESPKDASAAYDRALERIEAQVRRLRSPGPQRVSASKAGRADRLEVSSNFTRAGYCAAVKKAKEYIKKGDAFQIVLSQAFQAPVRSEAFDVYRALRSINPSPYLFYLDCGSFRVAGSSPEIHVRCHGKRAALRPIAGTRPRGRNPEEDAAHEKSLLADPKERAEHLMLVDLGRNDLGRVCDYKSVKVSEFMAIERYSHVMHIVSHVEGDLQKNKTAFDLLRATFPAGTISGAPKVRAMEIIDELENRRRGLYAGVVAYFSYSGNLDSCIAIRTVVVKDGVAHAQAGAGIVADSDPDKEYDETVNKAKALMKAIAFAESGALA